MVIYASAPPGRSQVLSEGRVPLTGREDVEADREERFDRKQSRCILLCRKGGIG